MADPAALLRIVERIYEAVAGESALEALAPEIAREFECDGALIYTVLKPGAVNKDLISAAGPFDDWAHAAYTTYYRERDEMSRRAVRRPGPFVTLGQELMADDEFLKSEVYNDYFRRIGMFHALAGVFPIQGDLLGVVTLHRPRSAEAFNEQDRRRLAVLAPHVQRAVQLRHRLSASEQDRALTLEVLERLALGAIVVDAEARVVFANTVALRLLKHGHGLTTLQGRLRAQSPEGVSRLEMVVREATLAGVGRGSGAGGLVVIQRPPDAPLSLLVSPFRPMAPGCGPPRPTALVMFSDSAAQPHIPEHILARVLGLAHAEARLLAALVSGQTMAGYSEEAGITMNTAKTQLRQIFLKTGHNRQADLIRVVLADPLIKLASAEAEAGHAR